MHGLFPGVENARKPVQFRIPRTRSGSRPQPARPPTPKLSASTRDTAASHLGYSTGGSIWKNKTEAAVRAPPALRSVSLAPVLRLLPLRRRPPLPQPAAPRTPPPSPPA